MAPFHRLTHKDQSTGNRFEFWWSDDQEIALQQVKKIVSPAQILVYYDPNKELHLQCDASSKRTGAALLQEGKHVAYMSRAFSDAQTRYAPIKKCMRAIVMGLE